MRELASQIRKKGPVAILAGNADAPNLRKRVEGVKKEAALYPGIRLSEPSTTPRRRWTQPQQ